MRLGWKFFSGSTPPLPRQALPGATIHYLLKAQLRPFLVDTSHLCVTDRQMACVTDDEAFRASRDSASLYVADLDDCDDAVKRMEFWFLKLQCSRKSPFSGRPAAFGRCVVNTTDGAHMIGIFITPAKAVHFVDANGQLITLEDIRTTTIRTIMI